MSAAAQTPFAVDSALKAPAQLAPALPEQPTESQWWNLNVRKRLSKVRRDAIEAGTWGENWRHDAIPQPCWVVSHLHSLQMEKLHLCLKSIGEGNHNRPAFANRAAIKGHKNEKPFDYTVYVSYQALSDLTGLPLSTVQRTMKRLAAVHSVIPFEIRRRDEHDASKNHAASGYRVPHYKDVLDRRKADETIAKTHDGRYHWNNGRPNSRRPLTPERAERWRIDAVIPVQQRKDARPEQEATREAVSEAVNARSAPEQPSAAKLQSQPRPKPAPKQSTPPEPEEVTPLAKVEVPEDQQKLLDLICGRIMPLGNQTLQWPLRAICDAAPKMLAGLQDIAKRAGKGNFPPSELAGICEWFFEKKRKQGKFSMPDENRRWKECVAWVWTADNPVAYLTKCCTDFDQSEVTVCRYLDMLDEARKKARDDLRRGMQDALSALRLRPDDKQMQQWLASLKAKDPELWSEVEKTYNYIHQYDAQLQEAHEARTRSAPKPKSAKPPSWQGSAGQ